MEFLSLEFLVVGDAMLEEQESFVERLRRIEAEQKSARLIRRRPSRSEPVMVVHADGVVTRRRATDDRLRFGFPLKGVLIAATLVVVVKAYLIWFVGPDAYSSMIAGLEAGSNFEQLAAQVLLPDYLSDRLVHVYDVIYLEMSRILAR